MPDFERVSLDDDIRLIAEAPLFAELNADQLRLLAFGGERLSFRQRQIIFREGEQADFGAVIAGGEVEIISSGAQGNQLIKTLKRPSLLGQIALITQTQRSFTAVATTDVLLLRINRSLFHRMLREYPETASAIHAEIRRDLGSLLKDIGSVEPGFNSARDL